MYVSSQVWLIFLGSLLTFISTWTVESYKNWREKIDRARNLGLVVKQELLIIVKALDLLKTTLDFRNYYDYSILSQVDESVQNLKLYKRDAIYFPSEDQQTKYIDLVSNISTHASGMRLLQNIYDDEKKRFANQDSVSTKLRSLAQGYFKSLKDLEDYFEKQKVEKALIGIELKRRTEEFINLIRD